MHIYMYRAAPDLEPLSVMSARQRDEAVESLGSVEVVKQSLDVQFVGLNWQRYGDAWSGAHPTCQLPYIDILLSEEHPGDCRFIILNKPDSSTIRSVALLLNLNYACLAEAGYLIDPFASGEAWVRLP